MNTPSADSVRETAPPYGPHEAGEAYAGEGALRDLAGAPAREVPAILERFAALRYWTLREEGAPDAILAHAHSAAREHRETLRGDPRTLDRPDFRAEAARANQAGHVEGAFALLRAGYLDARRAREPGEAADLAGAIVGLLQEHRMDGAVLWARRAKRLRQLAGD